MITPPAGPDPINIIPTINIREIDSEDEVVRQRLAQELYTACSSCGFFYLEGHGMHEELQSGTFEVLRKFFALDLEDKMEAHVQKNRAIRGYEPMGETRLDPRTRAGIDLCNRIHSLVMAEG